MRNKSVAQVQKTYTEYKNDNTKLQKELKKYISQGKKAGDSYMIGAAYFFMGVICYDLEDRDGVFSNAVKAVALLENCGDYNIIARAYTLMGYAYGRQENLQMELEYYSKAYEIAKRHRIKGNVFLTILGDLSSCYHQMGDCKHAIRLLNDCIAQHMKELPDNYAGLAIYTLNLSDYYEDNGEPEKAAETLEKMESWVEKIGVRALECDLYLRMALNRFKLQKQGEAERSVDKAFKLIPESVYPHPLYDDLRQVSHFLVKSGDKERSKRIVNLMTDYAKNNPQTIELLIAYRTMAEYHAQFGKKEVALEYYAKLDGLYDVRMEELKKIEFNVHKKMKNADREILKLKKKIAQSEEIASKEPLTGLLNRSALLRVSTEFINTAARKKEKIGAIFIDVDYFKECNDTYGHAKGDEILKEIAAACKKEESAAVRFARYGGDEFFGITRGLEDDKVVEIARHICERIRKANIPNEKNPNGQRVTLSVGVANVLITEHNDTIIQIANYADKAVYHAKNSGKNRIVLRDHENNVSKEIVMFDAD